MTQHRAFALSALIVTFYCGPLGPIVTNAPQPSTASLQPTSFSSAPGAPQREQLPSTIVPLSYDLALVPDAVNLQFRGQVRIAIQVKTSSSSIVLNADQLVLDKAVLDTTETATGMTLDGKLQRATLTFARAVTNGRHTLSINYHGVIGKSTDGFFAMDYDSQAGKRRTIATNFEPTSERRFMPSWDEPGIKATFCLTVDVPQDRMAVSNMPVASTEMLENGQKRVHFARTPKMSTYLYFLGIGDFERVSTQVDRTQVGVVVNRGDTDKGRYALGEAARLLHYYNDYFGVAYPLPKLDLIVAPGEIGGGAMENWGAIFYSQSLLLFDPARSTEADRQVVFQVVSHEMAHQWFGDLVTMAWWDDLWLNEGFARWMQTKAADDLHPDWKTGLKALEIFESGKRADAKPSSHPVVQPVMDANQAVQAFDAITYQKGAAVINMLEAYVEPNTFREGVRRYMHRYAYRNTVDADFWSEVQAVARKSVLQVEADFTRQTGLPLIRVETETAGGGQTKLVLSEDRFAEDPATIASAPVQRWHIPVTVSTGSVPVTYVLSGRDAVTLSVQGKGPVIVNAGQSAYVRTLYPNSIIEVLKSAISVSQPADQLGLLYDSWALGQSSYAPVTNYLDMARSIPVGADPAVWLQIVSTLVSIERYYPDDDSGLAFRSFARQTLNPLASRLRWDAQANEESNNAVLRDAVLQALGRFGDQAVITEARRRFEIALKDPKGVSPAVRQTAISIVARNADEATLDRLIAIARDTKDPLEKENLFVALAQVADPAGAERVLDVGVGPEAPAGTAPYTLYRVSVEHPDQVWNRALQLGDRPDFPIDPYVKLFLMPAIAGNSSDPKRAIDLQAYANEHIPSSARQRVVGAIADINMNASFRAKRLPEITRWLADKTLR